MEEPRVTGFPAHRLRQSLAEREYKKNSSLDQSQGMPPLRSCSLSPHASLVDVSPPSTPSPRRSFIHPGSTSTASPSVAPPPLYTLSPNSLTYPSQSKVQPFCEGDEQLSPQKASAQSSPCPSHVASTSQPTIQEGAIARASLECLSLEQHLHQCDAGQKEAAMQSFILERFLPAAKAVAADHDCALYTTTKSQATMPSTTPKHNSTKNTLSPQSIKSRVPSTLNASKSVAWSRPVYRDDRETESFDHEAEAPIKSCGSFYVGLKTAISRVHKVVHTSAHSSKSRAKSSSHGTSSDEEEGVVPKVKVLAQSTDKQRSAHGPPSMSFPSSSPASAPVDDRSSRYTATSRSGFRKGHRTILDDSPSDSLTSSTSSFLHNQSVKCHSSSPNTPTERPPLADNADQNNSRRPPMNAKEIPGGITLEDHPLHNASRLRASGGSFQDPSSRAGSKVCHNAVEGASGGVNLEGRPQRNACQRTTSGRDSSSRAGSKGSLAHRNAVDCAVKDQYCTDDEHEFHDALSRFDSSSFTPSDVTPSAYKSPKPQKASCLEQEEEIAAHRESCERCQSAGSAHATAAKQKPGQARADWGKESVSRTVNGAYSLNPSSAPPVLKCQSITPNGHKQWASPPVLGWPLGITRFPSGAKMTSSQEHAKHDDGCVASPRFASNVSTPPVLPSPTVQSDAESASSQEHAKRDGSFVTSPNVAFTDLNVSSPTVPPSPAGGSWLGRAMALNASKPSTLATLQQKEKLASVKKKLEFTVLNAKKEVRWEDVVKGSQMHLEQFRLSEEIRHSHPSNRSAMKPLRL